MKKTEAKKNTPEPWGGIREAACLACGSRMIWLKLDPLNAAAPAPPAADTAWLVADAAWREANAARREANAARRAKAWAARRAKAWAAWAAVTAAVTTAARRAKAWAAGAKQGENQ